MCVDREKCFSRNTDSVVSITKELLCVAFITGFVSVLVYYILPLGGIGFAVMWN